MKSRYFFLYIVLAVIVMSGVSCKRKTNPQLPSNKEAVSDKRELDLRKVNQEIVQNEVEFLQQYVAEQDSVYQKSDLGFWYRVVAPSQSPQLFKGDVCVVSYKLCSLDGEVLEEVNELPVTIGRKEVILGLDLGLELMKRGEKAVFIFPWNLAYGLKGYQGLVPPYTSVKYEVEVAK